MKKESKTARKTRQVIARIQEKFPQVSFMELLEVDRLLLSYVSARKAADEADEGGRPRKQLLRDVCDCKRCGYAWVKRVEGRPVRCPACKQPNWDKPKVRRGRPSKVSDPVSDHFSNIGRRGGQAQVPKGTSALSPEERKERGRKAAAVRWGKKSGGAAKKGGKKRQ